MLQSLQRIFAVLAVAIALPVAAQSDPPARVGRLAVIENEVIFRVDRNDQGSQATINWPISSGATLETGRRGRAEVWIGSTAYRLADDSQAEFSVVDDARVDVRLSGGSLAVSILDRDQADDVVIVTPDGDVRFLTPGRYRIDVLSDHSELTVQAGRATFDDRQHVMPVAAGQKASRWSDGRERLDGDRDQDGFDRWVADRENATLAGAARSHVSPHMTGYQDLDANGDWQAAPDYGTVWYPRAVAADWAPYRYGRWAWVAPWGWTWIDQAPWGFAPFHYGRWAIIHGRWGWIPGRIVARPVYAPALVGWVGNPGWSVGFSFGAAPAVGWFPLAPRDVYVPGHHHSHRYVRQINGSHIRDVAVIDRAMRPGAQRHFEHHGSERAVTVVPANLLREGRTIGAGDLRRHDRRDPGRVPQARQAPNAEWLAPTPRAVRPSDGERRGMENRTQRRDFDGRLNAQERGAARQENMPRGERPSRQSGPETANGRSEEPRREITRRVPDGRPDMENRGRGEADASPRQSARQAAPDEGRGADIERRRESMRRPVEPRSEPDGRGRPNEPETSLPPTRREIGNPSRSSGPDEGRSPMTESRRENTRRQFEDRPDAEPRGRNPDTPPVQMRREAPMPEMRQEERRPMAQPQEREGRREVREIQRMERPAPREVEAPAFTRQREMPRPAPEIRAPAPQPMREMPQQRMEQPRHQAPQGGGQQEHRRRGDDERGGR